MIGLSRADAGRRQFTAGPLPLSLYVHWPWCLRKCPYCDFNSHPAEGARRGEGGPPQAAYVDALLADLDAELSAQPLAPGQFVETLFIGGGTPSLIAPAELARLLDGIRARLPLADAAELTLEANPGALDTRAFPAYLAAGINRLSLGVQSLSDAKLRAIGRLHDAGQARRAVAAARQAGCRNLNLDLMFGLPGQTLTQARDDLRAALALEPEHLSYYQLTLEPGTVFAAEPPPLPGEDLLADMAGQGQQLLEAAGYQHYEVSAHAQPGRRCRHNLNYWTFGDYLGIGAGAHGKRTELEQGRVARRAKWSDPWRYLAAARQTDRATDAQVAETRVLNDQDLILEFALNALRLCDGVPLALFEARTGLSAGRLETARARAHRLGLLRRAPAKLLPTERGQAFLNRLLECFVPD